MTKFYNTEGMTTEKWKRLPLVELPIDKIRVDQAYVSIHHLMDLYNGYKNSLLSPVTNDFPHVVYENGEYWLEDGHHRFVLWLLGGAEFISCRLLSNEASNSSEAS